MEKEYRYASAEFQLGPKPFQDAATKLEYRECNSSCVHTSDARLAIGFHARCLAVIGLPALADVLDVTLYDFKPQRCMEKRREAWIQTNLESALPQALGRLPVELCHRVGHYCAREYVLRSVQTFASRIGKKVCKVDMARKIWARYVDYEGIRYIATLTNYECGELIFDPETSPPGGVHTVYIGKDHLGVRQLVFNESDQAPLIDECPGLWWVPLPMPDVDAGTDQLLHGDSDVSGTIAGSWVKLADVASCRASSCAIWILCLCGITSPKLTG